MLLDGRTIVVTGAGRGIGRGIALAVAEEGGAVVGGRKPAQMDRHIQPIEVGRVVAFLLSARATIIRGQSINVDGGDTPY